MTVKEIKDLFEENNDEEFLEFKRVRVKLTDRKDLHAFLLLDRLVPGKDDIVGGAEHDEIFLCVGLESLAKTATEEDILDLLRCGVRVDEYGEGLAMFV